MAKQPGNRKILMFVPRTPKQKNSEINGNIKVGNRRQAIVIVLKEARTILCASRAKNKRSYGGALR